MNAMKRQIISNDNKELVANVENISTIKRQLYTNKPENKRVSGVEG